MRAELQPATADESVTAAMQEAVSGLSAIPGQLAEIAVRLDGIPAALQSIPTDLAVIPERLEGMSQRLEALAAGLMEANAQVLERIPALGQPAAPPAVEVEPVSASAVEEWQGQVTETLKQFRALWTAFYGGRSERLTGTFPQELQSAIGEAARHLLGLLDTRPRGASHPTYAALFSIVVKMQDLQRFDLDPDSPAVYAFDDVGDRIMEEIQALG
jgi:hypothetical protein